MVKESYLAQFYGKSQNYTDIPNKWYKEYNVKRAFAMRTGPVSALALPGWRMLLDMRRRKKGLRPFQAVCFTAESMCWIW